MKTATLSLRYWVKGFVTTLVEGIDGPVAFPIMMREISRNIRDIPKVGPEWLDMGIDERGIILTKILRELTTKKILRGVTIGRSRMYHSRVTLSDSVMRGVLREERKEAARLVSLEVFRILRTS